LTEERNYRKELEGKFASLNEETEQKIQVNLWNKKDNNSLDSRSALQTRKVLRSG
jgi:hypothetical protein